MGCIQSLLTGFPNRLRRRFLSSKGRNRWPSVGFPGLVCLGFHGLFRGLKGLAFGSHSQHHFLRRVKVLSLNERTSPPPSSEESILQALHPRISLALHSERTAEGVGLTLTSLAAPV